MSALLTPHSVKHFYDHNAADPVLGISIGKWGCDRANGWVVRGGVAVCLKTAWLAPRGRVMQKARDIALGKADREISEFGHIASAYTTNKPSDNCKPRVTLWHIETAIALVGALADGHDADALEAAVKIHADGPRGVSAREAMKAYDRVRRTRTGARKAQKIVKSSTAKKRRKDQESR